MTAVVERPPQFVVGPHWSLRASGAGGAADKAPTNLPMTGPLGQWLCDSP